MVDLWDWTLVVVLVVKWATAMAACSAGKKAASWVAQWVAQWVETKVAYLAVPMGYLQVDQRVAEKEGLWAD